MFGEGIPGRAQGLLLTPCWWKVASCSVQGARRGSRFQTPALFAEHASAHWPLELPGFKLLKRDGSGFLSGLLTKYVCSGSAKLITRVYQLLQRGSFFGFFSPFVQPLVPIVNIISIKRDNMKISNHGNFSIFSSSKKNVSRRAQQTESRAQKSQLNFLW